MKDEENDEDKKKYEKLKENALKRQFKKLGLTVIEKIHIPTRDEQFDFFSKQTWERDPGEEKQKKPTAAKDETKTDGEENKEDKKQEELEKTTG
jgi:hypothetical protein